jgi:hypothetical protein
VSPLETLPLPRSHEQGVSGRAFSCSTRKPQTRLTSSTCRTPPGQKTAHPPGLSRDPFDTPVSMSSVSVSTRQQRFTRVRLPDPYLTPLGRLFLIAHHDGHQPTQHEVVWSPPPPGDSEGPKSFIFRAASLQKLDLPNLLHVQDTPKDRCTDEPTPTCSASASCSPTNPVTTIEAEPTFLPKCPVVSPSPADRANRSGIMFIFARLSRLLVSMPIRLPVGRLGVIN